ncbi:MAG TPA: hypothetical protein ENK65_03420, partial [Helicobacteraceae bacterium]|nr:hypothetical protein [Helicobacteraceae bacterium]
MMFKFIMLLSLMVMSLTSLSANEPVEHEKLPLSESLPYLETIESQALRIGNGPVKVYVFVDPLCPHSRNFLSLISQSEKMKSRCAYYLFLYTLPRFKSYKEVASIYGAKKPLNTLIDFMVHS